MKNCTFFGHRDVPNSAENTLRRILEMLIKEEGIEQFYVGNQGKFDSMTTRILQELKRKYPHIRYCIVLAYMPSEKAQNLHCDTLFPEELEYTPRKYAISKRNQWMIAHSEVVVTYVTRPWGGAAKYKSLAERKKKKVIDLMTYDHKQDSAM